MLRRFYVTLLVVAWAVSGGWLLTRKILPPLMPGARPETVTDLDVARRGERVVEDWFVEHGDERIGESHTYWSREADGSVTVRSRTVFRNFPLQTVLRSFAGPFGSMVPAGAFDQNVNFEVLSRGRYVDDRLESLTLLVLHDRASELARFDLRRTEGTDYELVATSSVMGGRTPTEILRRPLSLGEGAEARGPFSAGPKMIDLRVGQTWTESVAKPFTTGDSELLRVIVQREELLSWHGVPMRTNVVEYRRDTGIGSPSRRPDAIAWVDGSGETLQQDIRLGSTTFRMVRMPEPADAVDVPAEPTGFGPLFDERFDGEDAGAASLSDESVSADNR